MSISKKGISLEARLQAARVRYDRVMKVSRKEQLRKEHGKIGKVRGPAKAKEDQPSWKEVQTIYDGSGVKFGPWKKIKVGQRMTEEDYLRVLSTVANSCKKTSAILQLMNPRGNAAVLMAGMIAATLCEHARIVKSGDGTKFCAVCRIPIDQFADYVVPAPKKGRKV